MEYLQAGLEGLEYLWNGLFPPGKYRTGECYLQEVRPDAVIHTAANTDPNYCQENQSETYEINVNSSINIAGICADYSIPCAFTSTDIVFDGLNPPYREEDPVSPGGFYLSYASHVWYCGIWRFQLSPANDKGYEG
jgi:hypothetical protein